jgi:ribulose-phosphate 3-epimerase
MESTVKLSASLICANLVALEEDIRILRKKRIDYLHFDMMDGHFVPRIGLGTFFLEQLAKKQDIPVDVHLMVTDPQNYIDELADAGASIISFHCESVEEQRPIVEKILRRNIKAGIALRPDTPLSALLPCMDLCNMILLMSYPPGSPNQSPRTGFEQKVRELADLISTHGRSDMFLAVDGGVSEKRIRAYRDAGANFFILGSSGLFLPGRPLHKQIDRIRGALSETRR